MGLMEYRSIGDDDPVVSSLNVQDNPLDIDGGLNINDNARFDKAGNIAFEHSKAVLQTGGGGTDTITLFDNANNSDLLVANEGGPVEVLNANLSIGGNDITFTNGGLRDFADGVGFRTNGSGTGYNTVYDVANSQNLMAWNEGGPVEVLNSHLLINSNNNLRWPTLGGTNDTTSEVAFYPNVVNGITEIKVGDGAGNITVVS